MWTALIVVGALAVGFVVVLLVIDAVCDDPDLGDWP